MKLTRAQILASIFLGILIIILIGCYLFYPTDHKKENIPEIKKTKLNEFVQVEKMTKEHLKNDGSYKYIKSYEKDIIYIDQFDQEELTNFQRELSLTELEITSALSSAKLDNEKKSVEVKRTATSSIKDNILNITVFYHLSGHKDRYIQLLADINEKRVIQTQSILERKEKEITSFSNAVIDDLFNVLDQSDITLTKKDDYEKEIDINDWKKNRETYIETIEKQINSYPYTFIDDTIKIYYSYDQILEQLGFRMVGLDQSSEQIYYEYK